MHQQTLEHFQRTVSLSGLLPAKLKFYRPISVLLHAWESP
jgi:hypothetical protein